MRFLVSIFAGVLLYGGLHAQRDPARLTDGPMLGHVTSDSIRIWGRTSDPSDCVVRYGVVGAEMAQVSSPTSTLLANDNTGVALLEG